MGGGDQRLAAGGGGEAAHLDRHLQVRRAVVDPGQDVGVDVDHAAEPASASSA